LRIFRYAGPRLLDNAVKFTKAEGNITITIKKEVEEEQYDNTQQVIVSIKDIGIGIDSEILSRLFTKFATKSQTGGTGLGLYICKGIIKAHGGRIWAENNKDLAWELLTIMVEPKIISPWLQQNGFLPTQKDLGSGPQSVQLNQTIPYYDKMISMISTGHARPSISEYPQIAENVREAIEDVYYGIKDPKQALEAAAAKSAKVLGW